MFYIEGNGPASILKTNISKKISSSALRGVDFIKDPEAHTAPLRHWHGAEKQKQRGCFGCKVSGLEAIAAEDWRNSWYSAGRQPLQRVAGGITSASQFRNPAPCCDGIRQ